MVATDDGSIVIAPDLAPVAVGGRIETLDILRGFAVLGILAVNAMAFAWPGSLFAGSSMAPYDLPGANQIAVWVTEVLLHDKCRTLFSMLFGISIFLVGGERSEAARGALLRRRLFFLAIFGLIHGLAFWFGDILLLYAWSGLFMMLARSWSVRRLLWSGMALVVAFSVIEFATDIHSALAPHDPARTATAIVEGRAAILATVETVRSGWLGAMTENLKMWGFVQGLSLSLYVFPTVGLMMIGLGLFKSGFLGGRASKRTYQGALALGVAITVAYAVTDWVVLIPGPAPVGLNVANSALSLMAPVVTLAWAALLILMTRHGMGVVTRRLAPVGRMAFTNYLTQTLIMTSLFTLPWGPHLFGRVEPAPLWGIVVAVWGLQLIWSPLWLSRFEMGPLECVWRCLTYGRWVPFLRVGTV